VAAQISHLILVVIYGLTFLLLFKELFNVINQNPIFLIFLIYIIFVSL